MDEKALFTGFWSKESKTTSTVLSRIPEGADYRPDPKSRTAQEIAWQIVVEEQMLVEALENGAIQVPARPMPETMTEVCTPRAITTYLRPMGSTVPRVYGPTADEP